MNPTTIKAGTVSYNNLKAVAALLTATSPHGYQYKVEDVYFDFGQDWMWTTITRESDWGGVQVLSPRQWDNIIFACSIAQISAAAEDVKNDKWFQDKPEEDLR